MTKNSIALGRYAAQQQVAVSTLQAQFDQGLATSATIVAPVQEYTLDNRRFLGVLAFPPPPAIEKIQLLQAALQAADSRQFYIPGHGLHITIKNIRTIADPPKFSSQDVINASALLSTVVPNHSRIAMLGQGLLITPSSVSIPLFTTAGYGDLVTDLNHNLNKIGLPDDKAYSSQTVFFTNITIVRYTTKPNESFFQQLTAGNTIGIAPFVVDSVSLVTSNLAFSTRHYQNFVSYRFQ